MDLTGKTVLYIGPSFFGYEAQIKAEFERRGATVHYHSDKPSKNVLFKIALRLFPKLCWPYADCFYARWLGQQNIMRCDLVFVIKGEGTSPKFLRSLREKFPDARFVLYMWDSIANVKYMHERIPLFDRVLSFDPNDCAAHPNLIYRANFFSDQFAPKQHPGGAAILFIGSLNGDRPRVLARLMQHLAGRVTLDFTLYVRSRIELVLRALTDTSFKTIGYDHLVYNHIPASEIHARMLACSIVLDIEHPKQAGLTMRTFDAMAAGKKLITTNRAVENHDFYDRTRICVIDRSAPVIPDSFLVTVGNPMPAWFFETYSIVGWLDTILGDSAVGLTLD